MIKGKQKSKSIRILLVDDHVIVREGLKEVLEREPDFIVCGEAADRLEALSQADATQPHLAVVDLSLKNSNGLDLIKDLHARFPGLSMLVLSMHDESLYAERVIRAGARGYMNKAEASNNLLQAIRTVQSGDLYLSDLAMREVAAKALGRLGNHKSQVATDRLSDRELQIFGLLGRGLSVRQIGDALSLDTSTIETYRSRLKEKLGAKDANELRQYAIRWSSGQAGTAL